MNPQPQPPKPWGWIVAFLAAITAPMLYLDESPAPSPAPIVTTTQVDWSALIKQLLANLPKTETAPEDPGLLTVKATSVPGMAELRADGKFTEIRWNRLDIRKYENDRVAVLVAPPGSYEFVVSAAGIVDGKAVLDQQTLNVVIAGPKPTTPTTTPTTTTPPVVTPDPTVKVARATYVYERRQGSVPPPVLVALDKLNRAGVVANPIDQNVISGKGQAPAQHAVALSEAAKAGIPCLVVEYTSGPPKVLKSPTTEAAVLEAAK